MKRTITLLLAVFLAFSLASCGEDTASSGVDESSESKTASEPEREGFLYELPDTFNDPAKPYAFSFGLTPSEKYYTEGDKDADMLCCVSNIIADKSSEGDIHLIIPKVSDGAAIVRALDSLDSYVYTLPFFCPRDDLDYICGQIDENSEISRDMHVFLAFYAIKDINDPGISEKSKIELIKEYPWANYFASCVLEPTVRDSELKRLGNLLYRYTDYRYGEDKMQQILERISDEKARTASKTMLSMQLSCDTSSVTEITLPDTIELIVVSTFGRMDRLNKINGLRKDCKIVYYNEYGTAKITDITDESVYETDSIGMQNFVRALKNSELIDVSDQNQ